MPIYLFGNCNVREIAESKYLSLYDAKYKLIHSPNNYIEDKCFVPIELEDKLRRYNLSKYLNYNPLKEQFQLLAEEVIPSLMVFMPSHEFRPLYKKKNSCEIVWMHRAIFNKNLEFDEWFFANYIEFDDERTYLDRFIQLVKKVRKLYPLVLIVILNRISNLKEYGPFPMSALIEWTYLSNNAETIIIQKLKSVNSIQFISTDRIIQSLLTQNSIEELIPLLVFPRNRARLQWKSIQNRKKELLLRRDLDHLNTKVYDEIAKVLSKFLESGEIVYSQYIPKSSLVNAIDGLKSKDEHLYANALEYLIRKVPEDNAQLVFENLYYEYNNPRILKMYSIYFSQFDGGYLEKIVEKYSILLENKRDKIAFHTYQELQNELERVEIDRLQTKENICKQLQNHVTQNRNILIYGANFFGHKIFELLKFLGMEKDPIFIDDNKKGCKRLEDIKYTDAFILITAQLEQNQKKIVQKCEHEGFREYTILKDNIGIFTDESAFQTWDAKDYYNFFYCSSCGFEREYIDLDECGYKLCICKQCADELILQEAG